jgi:hypothetical protein
VADVDKYVGGILVGFKWWLVAVKSGQYMAKHNNMPAN